MTRSVWTNLLGCWAMRPDWFQLHKGQLEALVAPSPQLTLEEIQHQEAFSFSADDIITHGNNGTAMIPVRGPMMKRVGFLGMLFGFTGTDMIRQAVRSATANEEIGSILLQIESPGGHVDGIHELAEAVRKAADVKPVAAHIEDIGASAAFWVASQADTITANPTAQIGSIGTMAIIADMSGMAEQEGIKIHVISTGEFKGMGVPGTEVEDVHLAEIQRMVNDTNAFFTKAVRAGRGMSAERFKAVGDGRVHIASEAQKLGLIDKVTSEDLAIRDIEARSKTKRRRHVSKMMAAQGKRLHSIEHRSVSNA